MKRATVDSAGSGSARPRVGALRARRIPPENLVGGALIGMLGATAIVLGIRYEIGSLQQVGPGLFPLCAGVLLIGCGLVIAIERGPGTSAAEMTGAPEELPAAITARSRLRPWLAIPASICAFIVMSAHLGLLAASFATVFIGAFGDRRNSVRAALGLAVCATVFTWLVFGIGLRIQIPLFQWT